ncbi:MAG: DUF4446 family protein [Nocardioidaceae bacterium]
MAVILGAVAVVLAAAALGVSVSALRRSSPRRRRKPRSGAAQVPAELAALRDEVVDLRADAAESLRHLAVVRYDAFGDMGGHLSWSLALLDDEGDGVVLTSIHGRSDARTYAKNISGWTCDSQLSPEEDEALSYARSSRG